MEARGEERRKTHGTDGLLEAYSRQPGIELRNQIAEAYLHIARMVALRFSGRGVDFDDLYQVASLALLKAVERFDVSFGVQFNTYATPRMVGEVKNYFRDRLHTLKMPRNSAALIKKIDAARAELSQTFMRSPTFSELVAHLDIPEREVLDAVAMQNAARPFSLDSESADSDAPLADLLGGEDRQYADFEMTEAVKGLLERLDEVSRTVLKERYFSERSQREIARRLNVSQMSVSRIERKALEKLRALIQSEER